MAKAGNLRRRTWLGAAFIASLVFVGGILIGFGDGTLLQPVGWILIAISQGILVRAYFWAGVDHGRRLERGDG
jgi:hypothetical protein